MAVNPVKDFPIFRIPADDGGIVEKHYALHSPINRSRDRCRSTVAGFIAGITRGSL